MAKSIKDESLKEELCRHPVQKHLLVPAAELEPASKGALRARSVVDLLRTVESWAGSPEALAQLVNRLIKEAASVGHSEKQYQLRTDRD